MLNALRFLTILPLGRGAELTAKRMAASMAWFPAVGLLLGGMVWGIDKALYYFMPGGVTDAIVITALALVTGGLHLDGLADTCDGLYGGRGDRVRTLEIMKDSHVGAMGVIGLVAVLLLKYGALDGLYGDARGYALLLAPMHARWAQVIMAYRVVYVRKEKSLAQPFVDHLSAGHILFATLFTLGASFGIAGLGGIVMAGMVAVFALAARLYFRIKLGGITGDVIGAVSESAEAFAFVVAILVGFGLW
jgi:adenosylcobinamide-GDP ribazoletransferase